MLVDFFSFIIGKLGLLLLFWTTHGVNIKILEEFSPLIIHFTIKLIPQAINLFSYLWGNNC
jgi:hypothetical protein